MRDAPFPDIGDVVGEIPEEADVVVIGSGITGAAAVKTLCELSSGDGINGDGVKKAPRIVVLEARQLCSGATARNGGHIKCTPHEEFSRLRKTLGEERARKVVRMQMRHLEVLKKVGEEMPWGEVREVETVDVFLEEDGFERAREGVDEMKGWMPEFEVKVWEGDEMREKVSW